MNLGRVQVTALVTRDGQNLGTLWKPPFRLALTAAAKPGDKALAVRAVNLWSHRQIGGGRLPKDSLRHPDGTLKEWPPWVKAGQPSPTGRFTFTSWRLWKQGDPHQESGLLGPVTLRVVEAVAVK